MKDNLKKNSPALFVIIVICFFLPFFSLSSQGWMSTGKLSTFTGVQLVMGTKIMGQKMDPEPLAILAFTSAIIGLGLSLIRKINALIPAALGLLGFVLLFLLKNKIDQDILQQGFGMAQAQYEFGYWLTLVVFAITTVFCCFLFFSIGKEKKLS